MPFETSALPVLVDADVDDIAQSMREKGLPAEKPMLVRPQGTASRSSVGTRFAAAKRAGLERVLCVVSALNDERGHASAMHRITRPNHRPGMTRACTCTATRRRPTRGAVTRGTYGGCNAKTGDSAKTMGRYLSEAGEALEQSEIDFTLLDHERNLTLHCAAINALPSASKRAMLDLLLEHGWSVRTQAAVEQVLAVEQLRPSWLKTPTPLARVAIEPSFAKTVQSTLTSMADCHARLPMW